MINAQSFWSNVDKRGDDECWRWKGLLSEKGYGRFYVDNKNRRAHRIAFELTHGPVPNGLTLDHLCDCKACVNPRHLEPVSRAENVLRYWRKWRGVRLSQHTHCKHGHLQTGEAVYVSPSGKRTCRLCQQIRERNRVRLKTPRA